jgi:hypothetical protein
MSVHDQLTLPIQHKLKDPPFLYEDTIVNTTVFNLFSSQKFIKFKKLHEIILTHNDHRSRKDKTFYKSWLSYSNAQYEIAKSLHGGSFGGIISSYLNDSANQRHYELAFDVFANEEGPLLGERLFIEAYFLTFIQHRDEQREGINGHGTIAAHFFCNLTEVWGLTKSNM